MKNILFIWPKEPFLPNSLFKHFVYIGEVAGILNKYNNNIKIIDLSVELFTKKDFIGQLKNIDYICIPIEIYTARSAINLVNFINKIDVNIPLIGYGSAVTLNSKLFEPYFDFLIPSGFWGEILKDFFGEKKFIKIDKKNISLIEIPRNIEWAEPFFEKMPLKQYNIISNNQIELNTQCGCLRNCSFCQEKRFFTGQIMYQRPPEQFYDFFKKYDFERYYLDATTFSEDKDWCINVCKAIQKTKKNIIWKTVSRIDCIDNDIAKEMSKAGCTTISLGIETLNYNIQKNIRKIIYKERIEETFNILLSNNIKPRALLILGLPNQTLKDIRDTMDFINKYQISSRWKEYNDLSIAANFDSIDDFKVFERDNYFFHKIEGLSKQDYLDILHNHSRYQQP